MHLLKQSTAATVVLGPFVDSSDGATAETGLTISQADIRLSKNGAAFAQTNNATGASHMENGYYSVPLDTTDTNTVGRLTVAVSESGALQVWREFQILEETVYDALIGASAAGELAVKLSTQGKADVNAEADTALTDYDPPTHAELISEINDVQSDIAGLNDPTAAAIAGAVWDESTSGHTTAGTFGEQVKTDIDAILVDTAEIGAAGAGLTEAGGTGDHLTAINLPDQTMNITGDITGNLSGSVGSVTTVDDKTGYSLSSAGIQAIWDALTSALTTAGSIGKLLVDNITGDAFARLGAPAGASVSADIAAVKSQTGAIETDTQDIQSRLGTPSDFGSGTSTLAANLQDMADNGTASFDRSTDSLQAIRDRGDSAWTTGAGGSAPTADEIADAVLDEALAGHTTAGTLGKAIADIESDATAILADTAEIGTAGAGLTDLGGMSTGMKAEVQSEATDALNAYDPPTKAELDSGLAALNDPTAAAIADAVLDEATAGHTTAGTVGKALIDILADTNELQSDDVPGLIAALNDVTVADILTTQMTEAYAADGAAPTLAQALFAIQQFLQERAVSGTTLTVKKLDGSSTAMTFTLDDSASPTSLTRAT